MGSNLSSMRSLRETAPRRFVAACAALVLAAFVAACGSDSTPTDSADGAPSATGADADSPGAVGPPACSLVNIDDWNELVGGPLEVAEGGEIVLPGGGSLCSLQPAGALGLAGDVTVNGGSTVTFIEDTDADAAPVDGIGDRAVYSEFFTAQPTVYFTQNGVEIQVSAATEAPDGRGAVEEIARRISASL